MDTMYASASINTPSYNHSTWNYVVWSCPPLGSKSLLCHVSIGEIGQPHNEVNCVNISMKVVIKENRIITYITNLKEVLHYLGAQASLKMDLGMGFHFEAHLSSSSEIQEGPRGLASLSSIKGAQVS